MNCRNSIFTMLLAVALLMLVCQTTPAQFSTDNILVSVDGQIKEFSLNGALSQSLSVPSMQGTDSPPRDLAIDRNGLLHVYNGTFSPSLSTYDSGAASWTHRQFDGWDTVNNGSYGGIATFNDRVFLTDMLSPSGIVVYDNSADSFSRFATDIAPIDLNIGLDGRLYALHPGGSPEGRNLEIYDPVTFELINSIDFDFDPHRSIAVDQFSNIYLADWDGDISKLDSDGNLLAQINVGGTIQQNLNDIDVDRNGNLIVGNRFGSVFVTDTDFSSSFSFNAGASNAFVSFAGITVPEPSSLFPILIAVGWGISRRKR